jgi:hypothetical protein
LLAQNEVDVAVFKEQRCGTSVELKTAIGARFQPTLKGAAKMTAWFVERLDRTSCTLFALLLPGEPFWTRAICVSLLRAGSR